MTETKTDEHWTDYASNEDDGNTVIALRKTISAKDADDCLSRFSPSEVVQVKDLKSEIQSLTRQLRQAKEGIELRTAQYLDLENSSDAVIKEQKDKIQHLKQLIERAMPWMNSGLTRTSLSQYDVRKDLNEWLEEARKSL